MGRPKARGASQGPPLQVSVHLLATCRNLTCTLLINQRYPRTEPEQTFLRAAWPTNKNGVSQFTSIFPGERNY